MLFQFANPYLDWINETTVSVKCFLVDCAVYVPVSPRRK